MNADGLFYCCLVTCVKWHRPRTKILLHIDVRGCGLHTRVVFGFVILSIEKPKWYKIVGYHYDANGLVGFKMSVL